MHQNNNQKLYTLKEVCEFLSISTATGRNWIKSGRLTPSSYLNKKPVFSEAALFSLKAELFSGTASTLKSRRNKTFINAVNTYSSYIAKDSDNHAALEQILHILHEEEIPLDEPLLLFLLRNCANQLLIAADCNNTAINNTLLDNLISAKDFSAFRNRHASLTKISYTYYPNEDTLGFLYLSLCNLRNRKSSGSYYTPEWLAKRMVQTHLTELTSTMHILDPSCGTGIFLLQLPNAVPLNHIHGNDLNPVSVLLTRINLALKYKISTLKELEILQKNITASDFLYQNKNKPEAKNTYDIILGNPPWGAKFAAKEKKNYRKHFTCAGGSSMESFDLFIEQSLNHLSENGILSFVLPEAILNVKAHRPVRELLLSKTAVLSVEYLGEAFEQVHCPSIILTVCANMNHPFFNNVTVYTPTEVFSTQTERTFQADFFSFLLKDEEYLLLQKITTHPNTTTLVEQSVFALGIVTGNNASLLHSIPSPGLEPVIRGTDISKYHINSHSGYLSFQPENFQQTAPEALYRAPEKLFYRFINKQLIFAYDNTGLLSLNSCNILIPQIPELSIKYILAVLNSSVAQFIFEKKFHSIKVLRSHLEQLPIPLADKKAQTEIIALVDHLINLEESSEEYQAAFNLLDRKIASLFDLTAEEYQRITS